ncbi:alkaline phosphatase D family protein [Corynebacterium uberis]|uniref:alkaline phosphatase D family protein n=1 Tax=Corynebacterium uberis TaxID=2883169 RepID=UPI001D0B02C1|nr:alkaline phosphatase D family protein [Corynebacterium uberis]UDL75670.1 alkaline phosphatase D family protein [Corynebacterium uberis]UDL80166.1 alkaline phosphatase D family protein [Corynebacterium uberis]
MAVPAPIPRRHFLLGASLASAAALGPRVPASANTGHAASTAWEPFAHGVASGDPLPDAVILWTRVTPEPTATPGSELGAPTEVAWELASDPDFSHLAGSGTVTTDPHSDHCVTIDAPGLTPATTYWYRFRITAGPLAGATSRIGRTRTAPAANTPVDQARFGVCSYSNFESGHFLGYRHMADRDDLDAVIHLGDYTYEYPTGGYNRLFDTQVRVVEPPHRTVGLSDYRIRQGCYHRDPDLADLHARLPMICIWDDHEFGDNIWRAGLGGNSLEPDDDVAALRAAATQAYLEWMPVRRTPTEPGRLHRTVRWGALADIIVPDLRSYRDEQLLQYGKNNWQRTDPDFARNAADPNRTMMGHPQFEWFTQELTSSTATWQLIANEVMFAPMTLPTGTEFLDPALRAWLVDKLGLPEQGFPLNLDQWDGYMAERQRIIETIAQADLRNVVFLTGDIHSSWANDIPRRVPDYRNGQHTAVATEFVAPSISAPSAFESLARTPEQADIARAALRTAEQALCSIDPWFAWIDLEHHGYLDITVTPADVRARWHLSAHVLDRTPQLAVAAEFITRAGQPGAERIS